MKYTKHIFPYLFWIFIILFFNLFSVYKSFSFTNDSLYNLINKHKGYDTLKYYLDIPESEVKHVSDDLQKYILGKKENLDTYVTLSNGSIIPFYNDKATYHMKEVRDIIISFRLLSYISLLLALIFFTITKISSNNFILSLYKSLKTMLIAYVSFLIILTILATTNFDSFFIRIHEIFFNNDLWIFDPRYEYIICLLPEELFFDLAVRILLMILSTILLLVVVLVYLSYLSKTQPLQVAKSFHGNDDQAQVHPEDPSH